MDKDQLRKKKQQYPKYQAKLEVYQLRLNHAAVMGDMKTVGKYNYLINEIWDKNHQSK